MDTYEEAANIEVRRDVATAVLEAMDVDQYLIDAVRDARPHTEAAVPNLPTYWYGQFALTTEDLGVLAGGVVPEWLKYDADAALGQATPAPDTDLTKEQSKIWEEGFDAACKEIIRDLQRIRTEAITAPEHCVLNKGIAAAERQMAWPT